MEISVKANSWCQSLKLCCSLWFWGEDLWHFRCVFGFLGISYTRHRIKQREGLLSNIKVCVRPSSNFSEKIWLLALTRDEPTLTKPTLTQIMALVSLFVPGIMNRSNKFFNNTRDSSSLIIQFSTINDLLDLKLWFSLTVIDC